MRMPTERMLAAANEAGDLGNWIGERVDGLALPADDRCRLSAACLHISLTHHVSIATLVQRGAFSSAFALLRSQIDGHVRGLWLRSIATDDEIEGVKNGDDPPATRKIAGILEGTGTFDTGSLTKIADGIWPAVCDFTHTGIRVIFAHLRGDEIDPSFSDEEVEDVFQVSNIWAVLAGLALFEMTGKNDLSKELGERGVKIAKRDRNSA